MPLLAIIADDLTGALDTGVQFSKRGVPVAVVLYDRLGEAGANETVLVVDTESRHLPSGEAGERVAVAILRAKELGVTHFYKKTDSVLRGNVASELAAALRASEADRLHFVPAYPDLGRTTVDGVQLLDGVPIHMTAAASDPLDPVRGSDVRAIVGEDARIIIHDAATNDDLRAVGALLGGGGELAMTAGCAGFAAVLLDLLGLAGGDARPHVPPEAGPLLVIGGSVNALSLRQLDDAVSHGFRRLVPTADLKLDPMADREAFVSEAAAYLRAGEELVIQSVRGPEDDAACRRYAEQNAIPPDEIPRRIPGALAALTADILARAKIGALVIFGGDTAIALMAALHVSRVIPEGEPLRGVVKSRAIVPSGALTIVTKSGGFGGEDVVRQIRRNLSAKE